MIGPLRGFSEAHIQVAFASTFALFMVPGILLSHWFLGEYFPGAARVPVAFVLSVSLFGVLAIPALVLHAGLGAYLWVSVVIVLVFLGAAATKASLKRPSETSEGKKSKGSLLAHLSVSVLWVPFAALSSLLAYASAAGHRDSTVICGSTWHGCENSSMRTILLSLIRTSATKYPPSLA